MEALAEGWEDTERILREQGYSSSEIRKLYKERTKK